MAFKYAEDDNIVPHMAVTWESQVWQWPRHGEPGITLEHRTVGPPGKQTVVDALLYRDQGGALIGILAHYNKGNLVQKPDSVILLVSPTNQRQGVGTALAREATKLWPRILKFHGTKHQKWTPDAIAWADAVVAHGWVDEGRTEFLEPPRGMPYL